MNPHVLLSRRRFVKTTCVAGAAVAVAGGKFSWPLRGAAAEPVLTPPKPSWVDRPMRWAQLTLVEDDPGRFDLAFWLDYFRRTRSDAVCLSAGGCVAYYPTQVPFHHRSQWLGDRDVFGELVAGCRKLGMVVIARTDPHATYNDVHQAHPDWIAVDAEGRPRRHWASPEMWITCALGPYNFEFMTEVKKEIMSRYRVDAIFINRWDGSGICFCEHCRRNFREANGLELPLSNNPQDPARRAYILWRQQRLFDLWRLWDGEVRKINPDSCVIPNTGGGATSSLDMKRIGELAPTLIADRQARRGLAPPWMNGKNGKEFRAAMGRKPIVGIFSVGLEEPYRWKDSVQSEAEIRLWVADGVANGLRPWFTKFSGVLHDERWLKPVEALYRRYAQWEKYLRHERPLARVGLEDAPRIINGARRVEVAATAPFPNPPLTLVPSYPDLPMEKVYPRVPKTDIPQVYPRESGRSRIVYLPWDIDRTFWEVLCVDHFKLLRNAVAWATNEDPLITVSGPGVLDVAVWQQRDSLTVHLVNLTNPMMMKGPVRELIPIGEQQVRLRLPEGTRARRVRLLAADQHLHAKITGRYLHVVVPSILDHEMVAIDL